MIPAGALEIKPSTVRPSLHYLDDTRPSAAENVALDEAFLMEAEENGGPMILRIWELDHPAVILGASCRIAENVRVEACQVDGVEIARRSSGGGTVVIGPGALNFSVILPIDSEPELRNVDEAQRYVLARTLEAIRSSGVPDATMIGSGDLTLDGRKFSGSAQRRLRRHVLIHASVLYDFPLGSIERFTLMPPRRPAYREDRLHLEFVTNLPMSRTRLVEALWTSWLEDGRPRLLAEIPEGRLGGLFETKFRENAWIERL